MRDTSPCAFGESHCTCGHVPPYQPTNKFRQVVKRCSVHFFFSLSLFLSSLSLSLSFSLSFFSLFSFLLIFIPSFHPVPPRSSSVPCTFSRDPTTDPSFFPNMSNRRKLSDDHVHPDAFPPPLSLSLSLSVRGKRRLICCPFN